MNQYFYVMFECEALDFLRSLEPKVSKEIIKAIQVAQFEKDPRIFGRLSSEIWELRIKCLGKDHRFLAFWVKEDESLVVCTHGFISDLNKTPKEHIEKAESIRISYLMSE